MSNRSNPVLSNDGTSKLVTITMAYNNEHRTKLSVSFSTSKDSGFETDAEFYKTCATVLASKLNAVEASLRDNGSLPDLATV